MREHHSKEIIAREQAPKEPLVDRACLFQAFKSDRTALIAMRFITSLIIAGAVLFLAHPAQAQYISGTDIPVFVKTDGPTENSHADRPDRRDNSNDSAPHETQHVETAEERAYRLRRQQDDKEVNKIANEYSTKIKNQPGSAATLERLHDLAAKAGQDPDNKWFANELWYFSAQMAWRLGNYEYAYDTFVSLKDQCNRYAPWDPCGGGNDATGAAVNVMLDEGKAFYGEHRWRDAEHAYLRAADLQPQNPLPQYDLAWTYRAMAWAEGENGAGVLDTAKAEYNAALNAISLSYGDDQMYLVGRSDLHRELAWNIIQNNAGGEVSLSDENRKNVLAHLWSAVAHDQDRKDLGIPPDSYARGLLADVYYWHGELGVAEEEADIALIQNPSEAVAQTTLDNIFKPQSGHAAVTCHNIVTDNDSPSDSSLWECKP
jgi:hypothetical protein